MQPEIKNFKIDVIIPVYKDYFITKRCIESVLSASPAIPYQLVIINDASPEPILTDYLRTLVTDKRILLLENEKNQGFVYTVNRGMSLHTNRDVILLNSDTVVANDWLDRLYHCAESNSSIGTVTPFSNNAEICSYPNICQSNELPQDYDVAKLDKLFAGTNSGVCIDIPTAVGFCMYIKRACLNQVGYFNVELFGTGYGEENDFCLRAKKSGWRNVICCDVFVFHEGSVSFGTSKKARIENATKVINKLYPHYTASVQKFILSDPLKYYRYCIDVKRLQRSKLPTYVFISHASGGGTEKHIYDFTKFMNNRLNILLLKPNISGGMILKWINKGEGLTLYLNIAQHYELLLQLLRYLKVSRFHIHHTLDVSPKIWNLIEDLDIQYDYTIHDYYSFCPQISLTTLSNTYCGQPDEVGCAKCLQERAGTQKIDIRKWRQQYQKNLEKAERVFVPSHFVLQNMQRYFKNINFILVPHFDLVGFDKYEPEVRHVNTNEPLKILVLGGISQMKGADIVVACAKLAKKQNLPLEFHLLGYAYRRLKHHPKTSLFVHGQYVDANVQALISKIKPNIAWFPSLAPETYSYTLSQCMLARLPIITTDIGAQPERIQGRAWSFIKSWQSSPQDWNEFFLEIKAKYFQSLVPPVITSPKLQNKNQFTYFENYIVDVIKPKLNEGTDISNILQLLLKFEHTIANSIFRKTKRKLYLLLAQVYTNNAVRMIFPEKLIMKYKLKIKSLLAR